MTILVTGATGTVGSLVLEQLAGSGTPVRALTRNPGKSRFPPGVEPVAGDLLDTASVRTALAGVSTLFLLNAVTPDELSQALLTLNLAREAGVRGMVYLSVFHSDHFHNVPHFTAKHTAEEMIDAFDMPVTVLRPNCFMQNDAMLKDAIQGGVYPFPIGSKGVSMVDTRDLAEMAGRSLLEREQSRTPLPRRIINVVGPDPLTGAGNAAIWSQVLGRPVDYLGDDTAAFERNVAQHAPGWMALDMRLMLERFQQDGMIGSAQDVRTMTQLLGHAPRSYQAFARETLASWKA